MARLTPLLEVLPRGVEHAFAYGSGVFQHFGSKEVRKSTKVLDYVLAVDDPVKWHTENLARNPGHYGKLSKRIGARGITRIAERVGCGVHFNPFVEVDSQLHKYGVVATARLLDDLRNWREIYIAGRLHKPVKSLIVHAGIDKACNANTRAAACAALLILPEVFTKVDFYKAVCSLSYKGDIRMLFAEDKGKVDNIVNGSLQELDSIYMKEMHGVSGSKAGLTFDGTDGPWKQAKNSLSSRAELMLSLPRPILEKLYSCARLHPSSTYPESQWRCSLELAADARHPKFLESILASVVRRSSAKQAAAGFIVTDIGRSSYYFYQKIQKAFATWT